MPPAASAPRCAAASIPSASPLVTTSPASTRACAKACAVSQPAALAERDPTTEIWGQSRGLGVALDEEQRRRLEIAEREMTAAEQFDHVVENRPDELETAARQVHEILVEEKRRRSNA